jgi:hypothetical protein
MSKYGNKQTLSSDGLVFGSQLECRRYEELLILQRIGEVVELQRQVRWRLVPCQVGERAVEYVADFQYFDKSGKLHVEDTKGFRTKDYIIKRKLMLWIHGVRIEEVSAKPKRKADFLRAPLPYRLPDKRRTNVRP